MFDYHMHTCYSGDSDAPVEDMIEAAIKKGLSSICITDHHDPDFPQDECDFTLNTDSYFPAMESFREKYRSKIDVRIGVELGLQPHLGPYFADYIKNYPFDFIIGSTHVAGGQDVYYPAYYKGRNESEAYGEYFETVLENLNAFSDIDVCGHLDYVVRYGPNKNRYYTYEAYASYLEPILKLLIEKNIGLEVNTGGYKRGLGTTNPMPDVIRRYLSLGGEIITLGADAHTPDMVAYEFPRAVALLKECGVRYLCTFQQRKPVFHKL